MFARTEIDSPLGRLCLVSRDQTLLVLDYADCAERTEAILARAGMKEPEGEGVREVARPPRVISAALRCYFAGDLQALDRVPVAPVGTAFQQESWTLLRRLPAGRTATYGELALKLGRPGGARAVGLANARNPIALVIPCHRVIRGDGDLGGYAGGIHRKRWLLEHEGVLAPALSS